MAFVLRFFKAAYGMIIFLMIGFVRQTQAFFSQGNFLVCFAVRRPITFLYIFAYILIFFLLFSFSPCSENFDPWLCYHCGKNCSNPSTSRVDDPRKRKYIQAVRKTNSQSMFLPQLLKSLRGYIYMNFTEEKYFTKNMTICRTLCVGWQLKSI